MLGYYGRQDNQYCCIVLFIPLATAWPEQGFLTLCCVKTKQRNQCLMLWVAEPFLK